jgi:alkanesulfonate monooxygenase SsuD/methylene tetrahydromethanopterin reductase-like flavin-dependent oxidoreductase (luciferase family)
MFLEFNPRQGFSEHDVFVEGMDLVDAGESWGLDTAWLSEFHFTPERSILSSPIVVGTAIASRTQRMRIGFAVYVLPLNHPLRIAEEIATLDQLSNGRVDVGVGRSGFTYFYRHYAIDYSESRARFDEAMDVIRLAWTEDSVHYQGKFYTFEGAQVRPRPIQQPHPPLRMAATRPETFPKVAEMGLPLFVGLRGDGLEELGQSIQSYRDAWRAAGHSGNGSVFLRIPVYVGRTERSARDEAQASLTYYFQRQSELVSADAQSRSESIGEDSARSRVADKLARLSYDDILQNRTAVGSPAGFREQLERFGELLGIDGIVAELNAGGLIGPAEVKQSLRLLTNEVMPHFK